MTQSDFVCEFNIQGRVTKVGAKLIGDVIHCDDMEFAYSSEASNITASLAILWGQSKTIDKVQHITIYQCNEMANNCSRCLALQSKFLCGWCQISNKYTTNKIVSYLYNFNLMKTILTGVN